MPKEDKSKRDKRKTTNSAILPTKMERAKLKQQRTDIQTKRKANEQRLEGLRTDVQNNHDKADEVEALNQAIDEIQKEEETLESEEKRLDAMIPMEMDGDSSQPPTSEGGKVSSATQAQDSTNEGEEDPIRNDLGQGSSSSDK